MANTERFAFGASSCVAFGEVAGVEGLRAGVLEVAGVAEVAMLGADAGGAEVLGAVALGTV